MNQYNSKKEQFTKPRRNNKLLIVALLLIAGIAAGAAIWLGSRVNDNDLEGQAVLAARSYVGRRVAMTTIEVGLSDGQVVFPLDLVDRHSIVYFEVKNDRSEAVPLMAYVTPSGRLFAGSSMCEPCRGRKFTLAGKTLVCDTCRTTFDIETQLFLAGVLSCGNLPPVDMEPQIKDGTVSIDYQKILDWKPRT